MACTMAKKSGYKSAERVVDGSGRQYHIGVAPGEVASDILLCGDPKRAERVAGLFDSVRCEKRNREYVTFTGKYHGREMSVMGTGIGPDNMEIAVIELAQCIKSSTMIRIGSCGGLQKEIRLGDLVVSTGAVRLENTSSFFVPETYPAVAHHEVVTALLYSCDELGFRHHAGITASAPGFYGAQSRKIPGFPPRNPDLPGEMAKIGVKNFEMEISALLTLASLGKIRAGAVCAAYAQRNQNKFITPKQKEGAELRCIRAGLAAFDKLAEMDRWKKKNRKKYWHP
jgi:uridine phosphorylase